MTSDVKHLFVIADHLDGFSCEMSIQIFCPYLKIGLFDLMLSCKSSLLYILDTSLFFFKDYLFERESRAQGELQREREKQTPL